MLEKILELFYKIKEKFGLPRYAAKRLKRVKNLYPESKSEMIIEENDKKMMRGVMICVCATAVVVAIICLKAVLVEGTDAGSAGGIIVLGIVGTAFVIYREKKKEEDAEKENKDELEIEYSELTSKLSVLVGAGLSVRKAWEKMVADYRRERANGAPRSALYEEMTLALRMINNGRTEEEAYQSFGERIGLSSYLRLSSILESNRKNGRAELRTFLSLEARQAFDERIMLAKKQGEKISSKLLIPMIMLFALVLLLLIIPAFMSF